MKNVKSLPWIVGAVMLSALLSLGAWMGLISPQLDAAAESREQNVQALERNDLLRKQNKVLADQFARIEEYRAALAQFRKGIPEAIDQAALTLEIGEAAKASKAFIVEISYPSSISLTSPNQSTGGPRPPSGLFAIPVDITILGSPEATLDFIDYMQQETQRLYYVSSIDVKGQDPAGATSGKPEIKEGDAQTVIKGFAYTLDPAAAPVTAAGGGQSAPVAN